MQNVFSCAASTRFMFFAKKLKTPRSIRVIITKYNSIVDYKHQSTPSTTKTSLKYYKSIIKLNH